MHDLKNINRPTMSPANAMPLEWLKNHLVTTQHTEFGWQECHQYELDENEVKHFIELIVKECIKTLEFHGHDAAVPCVIWMATNKLGVRGN